MPSLVLFLCTGNYYRSRFAELLFNHLAAQRGLDYIAISRGLALEIGNNVGPISEHARGALAARGIKVAEPCRMPQPLCAKDLHAATRIVALKEAEHRPLMEQRFAEWSGRLTYWTVHDLDLAPADLATAEIERLVMALIENLGQSGGSEAVACGPRLRTQ
jgi:protein-tyrosine phosphatase